MNKIVVKDKFSNITREVTQLTTVEDVNEHIDSQIEMSEIKEILNERNVNEHNNKDIIDHLMRMYEHINQQTVRHLNLPGGSITFKGFYDKALMDRTDILEMKREQMIECIDKYGEVWMNPNGTYSPPIRNYEIVEDEF